MNLQKKKVGIWGFGVVGKAALNYFKTYNIPTTIMDVKELTSEEYKQISDAKSTYILQKEYTKFFTDNDIILASPGIDLRPFDSHRSKFITELDLFSNNCKKPTIAITGTIGKTSITHILSAILQRYNQVITGGNIGIGMLDLLFNQDHATFIILEVSSFQLEHCQLFAPDLAIWTNFYPNHLDRHTTLKDYFNAKYKMLAYQKNHQQALIPFELAQNIIHNNSHKYQGTLHFFSSEKPCLHQLNWLPTKSNLFWLDNNEVFLLYNNQVKKLISLHKCSTNTIATNWLIITATLHLLTIPLDSIYMETITVPEHRIEKVATCNGIDFYNDSKATIMESTQAAVEKLQGKPIILLLGGLSKGVDRSPSIAHLYNHVKKIICFGAEALTLHENVQRNNIESSNFTSLDEAFTNAIKNAEPGDQILFSPGGSSYDLYKNYKDRGEHFKRLVAQLNSLNIPNVK
jgi:UDP-N-acetylmuramoylalanine--D-glutamate ligase